MQLFVTVFESVKHDFFQFNAVKLISYYNEQNHIFVR